MGQDAKTKFVCSFSFFPLSSLRFISLTSQVVFIHETNFNDATSPSPDSGPEDFLEVDLAGSPDPVTDGPSRRTSVQSPFKSTSLTPVSPRVPREVSIPKQPYTHAFEGPYSPEDPYPPRTLWPLRSISPEGRRGSRDDSPPRSPSDRFFRGPIHLDETMLPLDNAEKARLLRHFGQNLAIWVS